MMRALEDHEFLRVAGGVFQNSLGIELSNIHGAVWIFPNYTQRGASLKRGSCTHQYRTHQSLAWHNFQASERRSRLK